MGAPAVPGKSKTVGKLAALDGLVYRKLHCLGSLELLRPVQLV